MTTFSLVKDLGLTKQDSQVPSTVMPETPITKKEEMSPVRILSNRRRDAIKDRVQDEIQQTLNFYFGEKEIEGTKKFPEKIEYHKLKHYLKHAERLYDSDL